MIPPRPTPALPAPPEARRLNRIRSRLMRALRNESPARLRGAVVEVASDIEAMIDGRAVADELCADTLRSVSIGGVGRDTDPAPPPDFDVDVCWDSAPPVPVNRPSGGP